SLSLDSVSVTISYCNFCFSFFFYRLRHPPSSTLFPYTTLFRSRSGHGDRPLPRTSRRGGRKTGHHPDRTGAGGGPTRAGPAFHQDRKSTRLNSSHLVISYAVFCLKKKKKKKNIEIYIKTEISTN